MGKFFDNGEISGNMTRNGYGSYIITAENRDGDTIEIHSNDSLLFDNLDSEDIDKQNEAWEEAINLLKSIGKWKCRAKIKSYPTNIELFMGNGSWQINTDFQDPEYFDSAEDAREWAEDRVAEITKDCYEINNYDELIDDMVSAVSRYIR